jgi:hypothetical protein
MAIYKNLYKGAGRVFMSEDFEPVCFDAITTTLT